MARLILKKSNALVVAGILIPVQFMYAFGEAHLTSNMELICQQLKVDLSTFNWLQNIDTIICCIMTTLAGRLAEKIGITLVYTVGVAVMTVFNLLFLIPGSGTNFVFAVILTAIAAAGKGTMLPLTTPVAYSLVPQTQLSTIITIAASFAPIGAVISSFMAGTVGSAIGWQWMNVFVGVIGVVDCFLLIKFLPFKVPKQKDAKIDYLGTALISGSLISLILGLYFISDDEHGVTGIILTVLSVIGFVIFFVYNQYFSKCPIFSKDFFNRSYVLVYTAQFLLGVANYMDKIIQSQAMRHLLKIPIPMISVAMASAPCSSLVIGPITGWLSRKMVNGYASIILSGVFVTIAAINAIVLFNGGSLPLIILDLVISMGSQIGNMILMGQITYSTVRRQCAPQIGVMNQVVSNIYQAVGFTLGATLLDSIDGTLRQKLGGTEIVCTVFALSSTCVMAFLGNFDFEKGRMGWTYDRLRMSSMYVDYEEDIGLFEDTTVNNKGENSGGKDYT